MSANVHVPRFRIGDLPRLFYCFRVIEDPPGRLLGAFVPDQAQPHNLDVVSCHLDDPKLVTVPAFNLGGDDAKA